MENDDSAVQDFLEILEEHRKNCERQGKYVEAEIAKNRLEELKLHEENRRRVRHSIMPLSLYTISDLSIRVCTYSFDCIIGGNAISTNRRAVRRRRGTHARVPTIQSNMG